MAQAGNPYSEGPPREYEEDHFVPSEKSTPGAMQNDSRGNGSAQNVILIRVKEAAQISELEENLDQTIEFIDKFTNDKETLGHTYNSCQEVLENEFQNLRDLLDRREDILKAQLTQRFNERDTKLENQLEELQRHQDHNEETCLRCKETVATMGDRKQKKERLERIKELCQTCILKSPELQEVPVALDYSFGTSKETQDKVGDYGTLNFRRVAGGRAIKYEQTVLILEEKKKKIGVPDGPVYVPQVPIMCRSNLKYSKPNNSLAFEITINDVDLNDHKESESNKALLKQAYETGKTENTYVHVQCIGNNSKDAVGDWNSCDWETFILLSKLSRNGAKLVADVESCQFEAGMVVHGQVRLVYTENNVRDGNFSAKSEWFKESKANFGRVAANGGGGGMSPSAVDEPMDEPQPPSSPMVVNDALPDKIKFKCAIDGGSAKTIILKKDKNEMNFEGLLFKIRAKAKAPDGNFAFELDGGVAICHNDHFMQHCTSGADMQIRAITQG